MANSPRELKLHGNPDVIAALTAAFEDDSIDGLESYAVDNGVVPPDDRPGWTITYLFGQNGEDKGLHWYQPDDDPRADIDQ